MKIGPLDPKQAPVPVAAERKSASGTSGAAGPSASPTAAPASATVALSGMAALQVDPNGEGAFDAAKVERIAQAIRDGSLQIDAGAIADRLIANAQELLNRTSR
jgi:negative regulator of flagellin synthesis FlgM